MDELIDSVCACEQRRDYRRTRWVQGQHHHRQPSVHVELSYLNSRTDQPPAVNDYPSNTLHCIACWYLSYSPPLHSQIHRLLKID